MIPLVKPFLPEPNILMPQLQDALYSGYIAQGEAVDEFESLFKSYIGNNKIISVNSGTAALHIALNLCGVSNNDEVISTALTAEPTNIAIKMTGANVVWADINENTGLIDPKSVLSKISEKTKAIMLVDYAGMVCDLEAFKQISKNYQIPIIEDAAHALGAKYDGNYIGNISQYTIFSLQAIKHMTTVDGGFLSLMTDEDVLRAKKMRWFGLDKGIPRLQNDITECGYKYNMNNVNATIGIVQMKYIKDIISKYIKNGKFYDKNLKNISGVKLIEYSENSEPSYWLYTLKVENRESFIKMMNDKGITASPLHSRNDKHSIFNNSRCELPNLDVFYKNMVHIPCGWWLSEEDRNFVVETIKKGW